MKCDAVFEGGGVKGIAFVGAVQEAEKNGYTFERLAGTSAGSIVASFLAAGYSGTELEKLMKELSFLSLLQLDWLGKLPVVGKGLNIALRNGIYSSVALEQWMADKLRRQGITTFADIPAGKLTIIASDITNGRIMQIPKDLPKYGLNGHDFSIAKAVRMSCSIPYFFQPVILNNQGRKTYILDGGLLSNFPVWLYDNTASTPRWPTFGFRLRGADSPQRASIRGPISMFLAIISTMLEAHDRKYIKPRDAERTIFIPVDDLKSTDFEITEEQKDQLLELGRSEAKDFFEKWNFSRYIHQHRRLPIYIQTKARTEK